MALKEEIEKINPLSNEEMQHYELIAYTDGAC